LRFVSKLCGGGESITSVSTMNGFPNYQEFANDMGYTIH